MLKVFINGNKSISVVSDDANAENTYVQEALQGTTFDRLWSDTPVDDDGDLVVHVPPEDALAFLRHIEDAGMYIDTTSVEEAIHELSPHVGGGPKK